MKKISIIGLGWLGLPLAWSLLGKGYQVVGSKSTPDGVAAARMSGLECYLLQFTPTLVCDPDDLPPLMEVDALIITLPARRSVDGSQHYLSAVQQLVDSALAFGVPRLLFTSSTSVYGDTAGKVNEHTPVNPLTPAAKVLVELEQWLHRLPNTSVDILRLAGLVGAERHPGRFLAGKTGVVGGEQGVNLVHQEDVISAITLLLSRPKGGHLYNLCAPQHPLKRDFYPAAARKLQLPPPEFVSEATRKEGRWVDGNRICNELGFEYHYPDPALMPFTP